MNLQFTKKVESDVSMGQVLGCLVGRLQMDIFVT